MLCLGCPLHWLRQLVIVNTCLDARVLYALALCWPRLHAIKLSNNQLNAKAIAMLTRTKWLQLECLCLDSSVLGVSGIQHLVSCTLSDGHVTIVQKAICM